MDSAAYLFPVIRQISQLLSTFPSVINLGHKVKQPLICPRSELSYRFEPHGLICQPRTAVSGTADARQAGEGVPGVRWLGGCGRGSIPGTDPAEPAGQIEAYLKNIYFRLVHTAV